MRVHPTLTGGWTQTSHNLASLPAARETIPTTPSHLQHHIQQANNNQQNEERKTDSKQKTCHSTSIPAASGTGPPFSAAAAGSTPMPRMSLPGLRVDTRDLQYSSNSAK